MEFAHYSSTLVDRVQLVVAASSSRVAVFWLSRAAYNWRNYAPTVVCMYEYYKPSAIARNYLQSQFSLQLSVQTCIWTFSQLSRPVTVQVYYYYYYYYYYY